MGTNVVCKTNPSKNLTMPVSSEICLSEYIKQIAQFPIFNAKEEQILARNSKNGCLKSKHRLIQANLKLVVNIAKKIVHSTNIPMIDLVQEGNLGLMVAVEKFNWKLGYRFSTYASWWIKQAIFKAISEQSHSMKIPVYIQETLSKFSKIKSEMEQKLNAQVKIEDVAKKMNIKTNKIDTFLNAYSKTLSLEAEQEINGKSDICLAEVIEDKKSSANADIEYEALQNDISDALNSLKEREQTVLRLRFGLGELGRQTLEEIGKIYGVTKECIRQTESRALKKLKENSLCSSLYVAYVM